MSGLPFLCGGTQALFSVVPSRGLSQSFAVGVSRTCTRLSRRVVCLSGAEQKSSHSIAVGVSRTCTRLTRRVFLKVLGLHAYIFECILYIVGL